VDGRFLLKVACLKLQIFREAVKDQEDDTNQEFDNSLNMLWTAPELLRKKEKPVYGTQKGDVYSFAIIAQEVAYRAYPFFVEDKDPKGKYCLFFLRLFEN